MKKSFISKLHSTCLRTAYTMRTLCLLSVLGGLFCVNENAWGGTWYAKINAAADPSNGGYVYVGTNSSCTASNATSSTNDGENSASKAFKTSGDVDLWLCAKAKTGYTFKGWNTDQTNTVLSGSTAVPFKVTVQGSAKVLGIGGESYDYYAIFARLASSKSSGSKLSFANTTVTESSTWQTITINHAHAGTVTIGQSGHSDDFFIGESEDAATELGSFSSVAEGTQTLHIQFRPTTNSVRKCTLTVSSNNGLSSLTYYLEGTGYAKPSVTWVNEDGTEVTSGEVTLGKGEIIKATCATEQTITYSDYNTTYFEPVTYDGGPALRVKNNFTGTFSNLNVRANLAVNESSLIAAYSEDFKLNVTSLTPQRIVWNDDITDLDNSKAFPYYIPLNAVAYDTETNEPSGMGITYSVSSTDYVEIYNGQLKVKAIGGPTTITATADDNSSYASIAVSKRITVSDVKTACATKDTDAGGSFNKDGSLTIYVSTPGKMTFWARRENILLRKDLTVTEYNSAGGTLHTTTISYGDIGTSDSGSKKEITLQPATTSVKFSTNASYTYYITSIETERITSVSKDKTEMAYNVYKGMESSAQLGITYSNVPVYLTLKHGASSKWSMNKSKVGGCGKRGSDAVTLTFSAAEKGTYTDTLYLKSNTGVDHGFVKLTATVTAVAQFLDTWNIEDTYNTTDQTTLSAETREGKTNFTFSVQSSNPANIVSIDANGVMTFSGAGTAVIKAVCPAYGIYEEFSTTHNITINKVTPAIATNPTVGTVKYGDVLNNSSLSGGKATVTLRGVPGTEVAGTFTWTNAGNKVTDAQGSHDYSITFTPTDGGMYNSNTFTQSVTISRADGGIEMNNGEVLVKVAGINDNLNECKIDLDDLIASKIEDAIDASRAGSVSYEVICENKAYAAIDGDNKFSATKVGTYTIRATQAQTNYYASATDEFTVTVNKLNPTIVFDNTDDLQVIYLNDTLNQPAYRTYNGEVIDRKVKYASNADAIYADNDHTRLITRNVSEPEGSYVAVTITATTDEDALYNAAAASVTHYYAVYTKRSPHFTMDGQVNTAVSKTLNIDETATITYDENTDASLTIAKASEYDYISYTHNAETRTITVTAVKGALAGDGVQTLTLNQPGTSRLFPRNVVYTFTVKRKVSALSLDGLTTSMNVEDTVATPYTDLANTSDAVSFTCSPEGSMKYENGKLIALQAGTNTVTFSQSNTEYWTGISVSKTITVSKITPTITSNLKNRYPWYSSIVNPFVSENKKTEFTVQSGNDNLAKYFAGDDKIQVYGTSANSVTFTFNQPGNYKYNAIENYQKSFEIYQPNNRLEMNLASSNWEEYNNSTWSGNVEWQGGGILCGSKDVFGGYATNYNAKYIVLNFVGIPDTLTFDYERTVSIATDIDWYFAQSADGKNWITLKENDSQVFGGVTSGSEKFGLLPSTRYVKLSYSGNYGARFKNVKITQRKEIVPRKDTVDFGLGFNGNDPTARTITVDWYNVNNCEVSIIGADADRFILAEGDDKILSLSDNYGAADIHVTYKHDVNTATTHTATLHIAEKNPDNSYGKSADITLIGQTTPAPQTIVWREDLTPMPSEGSFSGAAYSTSGLAITLTSLNPEYVTVGGEDGLTLTPVAAGTAYVRAYQAGNDKWAEVADTLEIEVTNLKVQYITWNDKLSNLKHEDGKSEEIELHAFSSVENMDITYELDTAAQKFATIVGNVVTLNGWGRGIITAKQVGNEEYVAVQKVKTIVSRNPSEGCDPLVGEWQDKYTLHTLAEKEIELSGEPRTIDFWAYCDGSALWGMWVAEYYDGYWHDVKQINRTGDEPRITSTDTHFGPYDLNINSTKVKIFTKTGATMTRTFHDVRVTLAKYLTLAENQMDFSQVDKGAEKTQSFYINYSNISGALDVTLAKPSKQFEVITTIVGEDCGDVGKDVRIDIKCTGDSVGTETNEIVIKNIDQELRIPVSATVMLPTQTITWNPETTNILTTDEVTLSATATSELPVSFTSGNKSIADVKCENGVYSLDIKSYGDVTITAHQAGNDDWSAATDKPVVFHISRVTPTILTYPTATGVILPNTLAASTLEGGSVDGGIEGTFHWLDATQNVTKGVASYKAVFDPENDDYYETVEFDVAVEILKTPQSITWNRADESEEWCASVIALDATASSGLAVTYHSSDSTIAYHEDGKLKVLTYGDVTITAEQKGNDTYAAAPNVTKTITLKRNVLTLPEITVGSVYVHHFLSDATFPANVVATAGEVEVGGTFQWKTPNMLMDNPGPNNCTAVFTPLNENLYEPKECVLSVEVLRFAPTITHNFTTEAADYGVKISELVLNGSGSAVDGYDPEHPAIDGSFEWKTPNHIPMVRETSAILVFRPTRSEWYDEVELPIAITINSVGYIFTGDGEWGTDENWAEGEAPETVVDVIVQGNVVISGDVEVGGLTIEGGSTVTLTVDGVLTVNGESAERDLYGDVHVCNNGQLILTNSADLKVNDFYLDAKLGNVSGNQSANSGQVTGETALTVTCDAYFDLALDPSGECSQGWYDFTVPFPVDVLTGITRFDNSTHAEKTIKNEVNYAIMDFSESRRVESGYGWKKFRGVMQPGKCYTITIDDVDNVYRFKKTKTGAFNQQTEEALAYTDSEVPYRGWNGLGNGTLKHIDLSADGIEKVQIYNHASNSYIPADINEYSFVVGSAYFVQAPAANSVISYSDGTKGSDYLRAPRRAAASENPEFKLTLTCEGADIEADRLYVGASDEALDNYEIGRDLTKFGTPTDSKVAQVWANAYGMKLCDIDMPLIDNVAECTLGLYAPKAGSYWFAIDKAPENATLYLTHNGEVIWDLTASPYLFDLSKGTTAGYGLRIGVKKAPAIMTGVENGGLLNSENGVRKVIIDNKVYIVTPEGKMYDVIGKGIKF